MTETISSERARNNNHWIPHRRMFKQSNREQKDTKVEMDVYAAASGRGPCASGTYYTPAIYLHLLLCGMLTYMITTVF